MDNNCLIIAGEKSGEDHVMTFLPALKEMHPDFHFWGVGGDEMAERGVDLLYHLRDFSSWGFSDVIGKIPFYKKALDHLTSECKRRNCKVAILVDFQDFNMRLAKKLSGEGVRVLYYVAPQAWVWKEGRVKALRKYTSALFTILPFEKKWFMDRGVKQVISISHPLYTRYQHESSQGALGPQAKNFSWLNKHKRLLLLPGSRNFEVQNLLPRFMDAVQMLEGDYDIALVQSSSVHKDLFEPYLDKISKVYEDHELASALEWTGVALAASGTVTLACALFQVPTVMSYQSSLFNEYVFYNILNYKGYISLPNIVLEKEIFPELIQNRASAFNMHREINRLFSDQKRYDECKDELTKVRELLGGEVKNPAEVMGRTFDEIKK